MASVHRQWASGQYMGLTAVPLPAWPKPPTVPLEQALKLLASILAMGKGQAEGT